MKRVMLLVSVGPSNLDVIDLVRVGYAAESVDRGDVAIEKLERQGVRYDAVVIGAQIEESRIESVKLASRVMSVRPDMPVFIVDDHGADAVRPQRAEQVISPTYQRYISNGFDALREELEDAFAR